MAGDEADIRALLTDLESFRVERTVSLNDTDKFCRAICAFANDMPNSGLPGYLFVGVNQAGEPTGAPIDERLLEQLAGHRENGQILPIPKMCVAKAESNGKAYAYVKVEPSDMPPVRYKGVVHIRIGPRQSVATIEQERDLDARRIDRAATWDMRGCRDATLDDLALDLFKLNYLTHAVSREVLKENGRSIEEQMSSLRLFHRKLNVPTNGAILLFGKDPLQFFPGAYVQYVQYDGPSQAEAVLSERRLSGDLGTVMADLDRLASSMAHAHPVRREDLRDETVSDYPEVALHELLINAVIHRNYEGSTTPVFVNHFSDRVEIHSPGSLHADLKWDQFPRGTSYRNPVLAEAAKTLGFANRFGRGIAIAEDLLKRNGSPALVFIRDEPQHFAVIVKKRP